MGRFLQEDEDHLPDGIRRIAYDADTQVCTFQDENGAFYYGAPGARYGHLTPARQADIAPMIPPRPRAYGGSAFDDGSKVHKHSRSASENAGSTHQISPSAITTTTSFLPARPPSRTRFFDTIRNSSTVRIAVTRFRALQRSLKPGPEPHAHIRNVSESNGPPIVGILKNPISGHETLRKAAEEKPPAPTQNETPGEERPPPKQTDSILVEEEERGRSARPSVITQGAKLVPGVHTIRRKKSSEDLHNSCGAVEKIHSRRKDSKRLPPMAAAGAQSPPTAPEINKRKRYSKQEILPNSLPSTRHERHHDGQEKKPEKMEKVHSTSRRRNQPNEVEAPKLEKRSASKKSEDTVPVNHGTRSPVLPTPMPSSIEQRTSSRRKGGDQPAGRAPSDPTFSGPSDGIPVPQAMNKGELSTEERKKRSLRRRKHDGLETPSAAHGANREAERTSRRHSSTSKQKPIPERSSHRRHRSEREHSEAPQLAATTPTTINIQHSS